MLFQYMRSSFLSLILLPEYHQRIDHSPPRLSVSPSLSQSLIHLKRTSFSFITYFHFTKEVCRGDVAEWSSSSGLAGCGFDLCQNHFPQVCRQLSCPSFQRWQMSTQGICFALYNNGWLFYHAILP